LAARSSCCVRARLLPASRMPHRWSPAASARRAERARLRGYVTAAPRGFVHVLVPSDVAEAARATVAGLKAHVEVDALNEFPHHSLRQAVVAARAHLLPCEQNKFLQINKKAGIMKHRVSQGRAQEVNPGSMESHVNVPITHHAPAKVAAHNDGIDALLSRVQQSHANLLVRLRRLEEASGQVFGAHPPDSYGELVDKKVQKIVEPLMLRLFGFLEAQQAAHQTLVDKMKAIQASMYGNATVNEFDEFGKLVPMMHKHGDLMHGNAGPTGAPGAANGHTTVAVPRRGGMSPPEPWCSRGPARHVAVCTAVRLPTPGGPRALAALARGHAPTLRRPPCAACGWR